MPNKQGNPPRGGYKPHTPGSRSNQSSRKRDGESARDKRNEPYPNSRDSRKPYSYDRPAATYGSPKPYRRDRNENVVKSGRLEHHRNQPVIHGKPIKRDEPIIREKPKPAVLRPSRPVRIVKPAAIAPVATAPPDAPAGLSEGIDGIDRSMIIIGRNPIKEALRAERDFEKIMVADGDLYGAALEIMAMAKERHVPVNRVPRVALDRIAPQNQGMIGIASAYKYRTVESMLALARDKREKPFIIILDGITDPHNLGAIIRTAECSGAHGVIVPERRAVGLTSAAVKASAGAAMHIPVARVQNLARTIDELKEEGLWIAAAVQSGSPYDKADLSGALALVIGGEGSGVSRLVLEKCDIKAALPLMGRTESLNASVAAGILMYEILRRRSVTNDISADK